MDLRTIDPALQGLLQKDRDAAWFIQKLAEEHQALVGRMERKILKLTERVIRLESKEFFRELGESKDGV